MKRDREPWVVENGAWRMGLALWSRWITEWAV